MGALLRALLPTPRMVEDHHHLIGLRQPPLLLSTWDHSHQSSKHSCEGRWDKRTTVVARTPMDAQAVAVAATNLQGFRQSSRNSCVGGRRIGPAECVFKRSSSYRWKRSR